MGAESSNFAMNGPKNLSKSLYQKDRPFRAILDFAEKFQIFGILRLPNKFEDLKISSHFILLLNTSSKTICRKKIFGPISVEICCPEKMALNELITTYKIAIPQQRPKMLLRPKDGLVAAPEVN